MHAVCVFFFCLFFFNLCFCLRFNVRLNCSNIYKLVIKDDKYCLVVKPYWPTEQYFEKCFDNILQISDTGRFLKVGGEGVNTYTQLIWYLTFRHLASIWTAFLEKVVRAVSFPRKDYIPVFSMKSNEIFWNEDCAVHLENEDCAPVQGRIQNSVEHLQWKFFAKIVNGF